VQGDAIVEGYNSLQGW